MLKNVLVYGREKSYRKGEMILTEEESSAGAGLVLEGDGAACRRGCVGWQP